MHRWRLAQVFFVLCAGGMMALAQRAVHGGSDEVKTILVLYGERGDLPAIRAIEENLRQVFHSSVSPRIEVMPEYCDFARFPPEQHSANLVHYLRERYRGRKIDLIMPVAGFSLEFVLQHRSELFPDKPIVFCASDQREVQRLQLPADATGVVGHFDFEGTFALIQQLQPGAPEILIIHGKAGFDLRWAEETRAIVEKSPPLRARVRWFGDGTLEEAVAESRRLSPKSAVMYLSMLEDASGRTMSGLDVARDLAKESAAPVYGLSSHWLPVGILGGALYDFGANGRQTAELALRVLRGEWVPYDADLARGRTPVLVNGAAMKKWQIPESRLPADAVVHFRGPTLWEQHRVAIIGILTVVLMQSVLISGLLWVRARSRRSEQELRESEERMSLATDSANLGLWVWDISRDEIWVTPRFRSMFGFRDDESVTFAALRARVHPNDREAVDRKVRSAVDERHPYDVQYRLALPDGGERWIAAAGRVEHTPSGAGFRMNGVCRDITERRQAQMETLRLQHEMAHVGRISMMGQLASALAHEINQPLGAILRNAEAAELFMQSETPDLEEIRAILCDIRADDQRASSVIDRMRSLLKRHDLDTRMLDVAELVANVASLVRPDATTRHVKLDLEVPPDLPQVRGDRVHLQQVLLNLILNGMDALNGAGPEHRRVAVSARVDGAQNVEIAVSDTGHGIPADRIGRVFDPFFTTKLDGMGMGLPISRTIIEAHGGQLWAESNNGSGATFRFTLKTTDVAASS